MMSTKFQLFKKIPDDNFINTIFEVFGIINYDENYKFTKEDLKDKNVVDNLKKLKEEFEKYYLSCKFEKYFSDLTLNEKGCITILRQICRLKGYKVISKEKYSNKKKFLIYNIKKIEFEEKNLTVSFE